MESRSASLSESLPEKVRAFVAIYPPAEVLESLRAMQTELRRHPAFGAVRWTRPEQIHLTLHFFGQIDPAVLKESESILARVAAQTRQFSARAASLGIFPGERRPKILWAGLSGDLEPLHELKTKLDAGFQKIGMQVEEREFHPHFTLGRIGELNRAQSRLLVEQVSRREESRFGDWEVRELHLMQSVLSSEGASHRILNLIRLQPV